MERNRSGLPKTNRLELLSELCGFMPPGWINLDKRADLLANEAAIKRRDLQKVINQNIGESRAMDTLPQIPALPPDPGYRKRADDIAKVGQAWSDYKIELQRFNAEEAEHKKIAAQISQHGEKINEVTREIEGIKFPMKPIVIDLKDRLAPVISKMKPMPVRPHITEVTAQDSCPTCGQIVRKAHRERVMQENNAIMGEYETQAAIATGENAKISREMQDIEKQFKADEKRLQSVEAMWRRIVANREALKARLYDLQANPPALPARRQFGGPPVPPTESYSHEEAAEADSVLREFLDLKAKHDYVKEQHTKAGDRRVQLQNEISLGEKSIFEMKVLEEKLKALPSAELERLQSYLEMPSVWLDMTGKDVLIMDRQTGRPYHSLSTGEQMKAGLEIAHKLNALATRPPNVLFLDDAELMDCYPIGDSAQYFVATVDPSLDEILVAPY